MPRPSKYLFPIEAMNIVGTIHTPGGFAAARKSEKLIDLAEVRADHLGIELCRAEMPQMKMPAILTVRRQDEGGARFHAPGERLAAYEELLPHAAAVDLELRSVKELGSVIEHAKRKRVAVILSYHDFEATPSLRKLRETIRKAREAGADIPKIATLLRTPSDAARLLEAFDGAGPVALMGMGALGRASRLLLAQAGSSLNYGWLHKPQVSGQWSAAELRRILDRLA